MIEAFAPLIAGQPHTLILGSIPGIASLNAVQYYAHPRNAFWPIMADIIGFDPTLDYPQRCEQLTNAGYALWDSLARCEREGSLDSAIKRDSEVANAIPELLLAYPSIRRIACNGGKSWQSFCRHIRAQLLRDVELISLPSTSPANARMTFTEKATIWRQSLAFGE
ncbi:DNA-deoxyinosine glycosylase [Cardiobacteriaceae bacterium TAE3-ERU3]|nr:DNA-deoxyinosine glycosylase [Cardiobacteriaceae bacterium TAE3-ERU3]